MVTAFGEDGFQHVGMHARGFAIAQLGRVWRFTTPNQINDTLHGAQSTVLRVGVIAVAVTVIAGSAGAEQAQADPDGCQTNLQALTRLTEQIRNTSELLENARRRVADGASTLRIIQREASDRWVDGATWTRAEIETQRAIIHSMKVDMDRNIPGLQRDLAELRARHAEMSTQYWDNCGGPPGVCSVAPSPSMAPAYQSQTPTIRREIDQTISELTVPASQDVPDVGMVQPDGSVVDAATGVPLETPESRPGNPSYLGVNFGAGSPFVPGQVFTVGYYQVTVLDGTTETFAQFTGSQGILAAGGSPIGGRAPVSMPISDLFPVAFFHVPSSNSSPGPVTRVLPFTAALPLLRPAAQLLFRLLSRVAVGVGLYLLSERRRERERMRPCGVHAELIVKADAVGGDDRGNTGGSGGSSPLRILPGRVRTSDAAQNPLEIGGGDSGGGGNLSGGGGGTSGGGGGAGGGGGTVHFVGSTCGSPTGRWNWKIYVGDDDGHGFSIDANIQPSLSRLRNVSDSQTYVHVFEPREVDMESQTGRDIWDRMRREIKAKSGRNLAAWRARVIDTDGLGRGRLGKFEWQHTAAGSTVRIPIKSGCTEAPPPHYQSSDSPM